jgi:hypothetical protein
VGFLAVWGAVHATLRKEIVERLVVVAGDAREQRIINIALATSVPVVPELPYVHEWKSFIVNKLYTPVL